MTDNLAADGARARTPGADFSLGKAAQANTQMDACYSNTDAGPELERAVFNIQLRTATWNVTLDGARLGDYGRMEEAMEAVEAKACALRAAGRAVAIVTRSPSGAVLISTVLEADLQRRAASAA
jgi:hypothetical protein